MNKETFNLRIIDDCFFEECWIENDGHWCNDTFGRLKEFSFSENAIDADFIREYLCQEYGDRVPQQVFNDLCVCFYGDIVEIQLKENCCPIAYFCPIVYFNNKVNL